MFLFRKKMYVDVTLNFISIFFISDNVSKRDIDTLIYHAETGLSKSKNNLRAVYVRIYQHEIFT